MNIEERILDNTLRDATRIVSQKPHDSEGKDGDFAVGNTIDGTKLFAKVKNKWHAFSTRRPEEEEKVTSFGREFLPDQGVYIIYGGMSGNGADPEIVGDSSRHILPLGAGYPSDVTDFWQGNNLDVVQGGFFKTTFLVPFNAVIDKIFIRATTSLVPDEDTPYYGIGSWVIGAGPGGDFFSLDGQVSVEMGWDAYAWPNHNDPNFVYTLTTEMNENFNEQNGLPFIPRDTLVMIFVRVWGGVYQALPTSTKINYSIPVHMYRPGGPRR